MRMEPNRDVIPLQLRLPTELRDWLKRRAANNHRSMNGEIVSILEEARVVERWNAKQRQDPN